ncbi:MAG: hypothetical protein K2X48_04535 [Chitinophagaceae bacterium]|nr:hypothetical protein [Chitinophagaceae bacterium]
MNYKEQKVIHVMNGPASFDKELKEMMPLAAIKKEVKAKDKAEFIISFCTKLKEVEATAALAQKTLQDDGLLWMVYPKGTSKKYKCEFNRDTGWDSLGKAGFEPVRMVAIDEDWSALRFRRVEFIKTMIRSFAMTEEGKKRIAKKK